MTLRAAQKLPRLTCKESGEGKAAVASRVAKVSRSANWRSSHRVAAALVVLVLLAGCLFTPSKALAPLPEETRTELALKGLALGAPLYIRLFKLEAEMEVWMQGSSGAYQLFRTYPICNWSGDVGPKIKEGDKQAPEGFYVVTASQMNPNSKFYLSFNIGYPNAYDRSRGYTGSALMVHGGCRSQGCYAITDEAIQELYILARDAFAKGQREFPGARVSFPHDQGGDGVSCRQSVAGLLAESQGRP